MCLGSSSAARLSSIVWNSCGIGVNPWRSSPPKRTLLLELGVPGAFKIPLGEGSEEEELELAGEDELEDDELVTDEAEDELEDDVLAGDDVPGVDVAGVLGKGLGATEVVDGMTLGPLLGGGGMLEDVLLVCGGVGGVALGIVDVTGGAEEELAGEGKPGDVLVTGMS